MSLANPQNSRDDEDVEDPGPDEEHGSERRAGSASAANTASHTAKNVVVMLINSTRRT